MRQPFRFRAAAPPADPARAGRLRGWILALAVVSGLAPVAALGQDELTRWRADCGHGQPLAGGRCRVSPVEAGARPEFAVMFAYVGRDLTFTIIGQRHFTQGEVRIDGKQIFVTRICGRGYCFMDGQLASQLAEQFRRGRQVEIEVSTPAHDVSYTAHYELKGFEAAFASLPQRGS